jgi:hypothetical protein
MKAGEMRAARVGGSMGSKAREPAARRPVGLGGKWDGVTAHLRYGQSGFLTKRQALMQLTHVNDVFM